VQDIERVRHAVAISVLHRRRVRRRSTLQRPTRLTRRRRGNSRNRVSANAMDDRRTMMKVAEIHLRRWNADFSRESRPLP